MSGALGDGEGKWRLDVSSDQRIVVMNLLESPTGHLANLSTAPETELAMADGGFRHRVPLFPAADHATREGFVRVANRGDRAGTIRIYATDGSSGWRGPVTLEIGANAVVHFNSRDLERGNASKGMSGGVGAGSGAWRLRLEGDLDLKVLAYMRTKDGFLTSMHDLAVPRENRLHLATFNPGSNENQVSRVRLVNPGSASLVARVDAVDDAGATPGRGVRVVVPAFGVRTFSAAELESATGAESTGSIGDGSGKWRLIVTADAPVRAMNLLESPSGHLTNLSANLPRVGRGAVSVSGDMAGVDDGGSSPSAPGSCTLYAVGGRPLAEARTDGQGAFAMDAPPRRHGFVACSVRALPAVQTEAFLAGTDGSTVSGLGVSPRSTVLALVLRNDLANDPDIDLSARYAELAADLPGSADGELLMNVAEFLFNELRQRKLDVPFLPAPDRRLRQCSGRRPEACRHRRRARHWRGDRRVRCGHPGLRGGAPGVHGHRARGLSARPGRPAGASGRRPGRSG